MRNMYWFLSLTVAVVAGVAFYGWHSPESCVGKFAQSTYELGCRVNPLNMLSERARTHDAIVQAMDEDLLAAAILAQGREEATPCCEENGMHDEPRVLHLVGAIELPAPIVFKNQAPFEIVGGAIVAEKTKPTQEAVEDTKFLNVVYEEYDSVKDSTARPMPTADESLNGAEPIKKMPYAYGDILIEAKQDEPPMLLFGFGVNRDAGLNGFYELKFDRVKPMKTEANEGKSHGEAPPEMPKTAAKRQ